MVTADHERHVHQSISTLQKYPQPTHRCSKRRGVKKFMPASLKVGTSHPPMGQTKDSVYQNHDHLYVMASSQTGTISS